mgnify:CR=1 FL=1
MIEKLQQESKELRASAFKIMVFSEGVFNLQDLYALPAYQHEEIMESFSDRSKKQQESLDQAKGKNTQTL